MWFPANLAVQARSLLIGSTPAIELIIAEDPHREISCALERFAPG
jgi:hypothetical protein